MRERPIPSRYEELFGEAFAAALPAAREGLTEEEARAAAEGAWEAAREQVIGFAAMTLTLEAGDLKLERERAELGAKRRAEEAARIEREGRAALKKLFGAKIAKAVELHTAYRIVRVDGRLLAVPDGDAEGITTALRRAGGDVELTSRAGVGYRLGKVLEGLEGSLDAVLTGPEALADAVELVQAEATRRRAAEADEHARQTRAATARREADAQRRTYGVTVGDDDAA